MTLKEIASLAGVSVSTVSRIINSPDNSFARKEVRDQVWKIIKETGYTPNLHARALKCGKLPAVSAPAGSIACILGRSECLEENPFFEQLARTIEQQALAYGFPVRLSYSLLDVQDSVPEKIRHTKTDGAIVLGRFRSDSIRFLEHQYKNFVYVGRSAIPVKCDQILCDGYEAAQTAIAYLLHCGHRKIGYIGETHHEVRYCAYLDMLQESGLEVSPQWICDCPQNAAGGYLGANQLLKHGHLPTAVFCAADVTAIAALHRFTAAKIKVPEQLSIISLDNIDLSGYATPMLTTVSMPASEMGRLAVKTLIDRIEKKHTLPLRTFLPSSLMIRKSVVQQCCDPISQKEVVV